MFDSKTSGAAGLVETASEYIMLGVAGGNVGSASAGRAAPDFPTPPKGMQPESIHPPRSEMTRAVWSFTGYKESSAK